MLQVLSGQRPIAVVVGCSDSRVPPEIIFDQGIGDLLVVRSAGEAIGRRNEDTIQLAVDLWDVPLVIVLGHSRCGAVRATVEHDVAHAYLGDIERSIEPALEAAQGQSGDLVDNTTRAHVERVVNELRALQPVMAPRCRDGRLLVKGAFYDLETGLVSILPDAPQLGRYSPSSAAMSDLSRLGKPEVLGRGPRKHTATRDGAAQGAAEYATDEGAPDPVRKAAEIAEPGAAPVPSADPIPPDSPAGASPFPPPWEAGRPEPAGTRWCPHCRTEEDDDLSHCPRCGVALVGSSFVVRCPGCGSENPISALRCRGCSGPMQETSTRRDLPPPMIGLPHETRKQRATSPGLTCGGSAALGLLIVGLIAFAVWQASILVW